MAERESERFSFFVILYARRKGIVVLLILVYSKEWAVRSGTFLVMMGWGSYINMSAAEVVGL